MMILRSNQMAAAAALAIATVFGLPAHATVVDFEDVTPSIFGDGETFTSDGFNFTTVGVLGGVDTTDGFYGVAPPSNDSTQFYYGLDDSHVVMTAAGGQAFSLSGFDAGFVAQAVLGAGVDSGQILVSATELDGTVVDMGFSFALSGDDGSTAFSTYSFAALTGLSSVDFSACTYDDSGACVNSNDFVSQFALDNINVSAVPEPASVLTMGLGLGLLALSASCRRRFHA